MDEASKDLWYPTAATISERVKRQRQRKGMTIPQVVKVLGCQRRYGYRLEEGFHIPSVVMLVRLSRLFDCSLDYLVGLKEERHR